MGNTKSSQSVHLIIKNGTPYMVDPPEDTVASIVGASFLVIIFIIAFSLNAIVVVTIGSSFTLRRHQFNVFVLNVSLCCVLECLLNVSMSIVYLIKQAWEFGQETCNVNASCMQLMMVTSTFALVAVVTDRTTALKNPAKYNQRFKSVLPKLVVPFLWVCAVALTFPPAAFLFDAKPFSTKYSCAVVGVKKWEYSLSVSAIGFLVPWCVILVDVVIIGGFICEERRKQERRQRTTRNRSETNFLFTSAQVWNELENLVFVGILLVLYTLLLVPHILTMQIHQVTLDVGTSPSAPLPTTAPIGNSSGLDRGKRTHALSEMAAGTYDEAFVWLRYIYSLCVPLLILKVNKDIRKKCEITFCCCRTNAIAVSSPRLLTALPQKKALQMDEKKTSKKKQKYKSVAPFKTPVLFSTSEGLHLRVVDDNFSGFTDNRDLLDQSLGKSQWSVEPKFVCDFCDVSLQVEDFTNMKATPHFGEVQAKEEDMYVTDDVETDGDVSNDDKDVRFRYNPNFKRPEVDPLANVAAKEDGRRKRIVESASGGNKKNVRFSSTINEIPRQWMNDGHSSQTESLAESGVWSGGDSMVDEDLPKFAKIMMQNENTFLDANTFLEKQFLQTDSGHPDRRTQEQQEGEEMVALGRAPNPKRKRKTEGRTS